ncbi:hypothetical protein HDU97_002190 [Phlyctochytrium planicorne]|nr:hypothetical protein HDU97_002190 [Phlyctochytrium planicorne]
MDCSQFYEKGNVLVQNLIAQLGEVVSSKQVKEVKFDEASFTEGRRFYTAFEDNALGKAPETYLGTAYLRRDDASAVYY